MNQTNPRIIYVVVGTAALLSLVFFISMAVLCFSPVEPPERVFNAFVTAGSSILAFLFGMLVNTRTTPPTAESTTTSTVTTKPVESPAP
ncbi:MAG: hypothetical protein QOE70_4029 [Chthoniobacter sp.]|jgi:hypothetical protein|nr:hypothetical protein [Chthoniobacter sp.]